MLLHLWLTLCYCLFKISPFQVTLVPKGSNPFTCQQTVFGWGYSNITKNSRGHWIGDRKDKLQYLTITILDRRACKKYFYFNLRKDQLCGGSGALRKSTCNVISILIWNWYCYLQLLRYMLWTSSLDVSVGLKRECSSQATICLNLNLKHGAN